MKIGLLELESVLHALSTFKACVPCNHYGQQFGGPEWAQRGPKGSLLDPKWSRTDRKLKRDRSKLGCRQIEIGFLELESVLHALSTFKACRCALQPLWAAVWRARVGPAWPQRLLFGSQVEPVRSKIEARQIKVGMPADWILGSLNWKACSTPCLLYTSPSPRD